MERALFVAQQDSTESRDLLREAGELAGGVDAELVVLHVMREEDYEERAASRRETEGFDDDGGEYSTYPITQAEDDARRIADSMGDDVFEDVSVDWEPVGAVGREGRTIFEVAENRDVDHLFVLGKRRSPSGKAIFGDLAQRLIIEFDGPVTTVVPPEQE